MAPTASPLCGAAVVVSGLTTADVADAPGLVEDSLVVDVKVDDDEYTCSSIVLPTAVI